MKTDLLALSPQELCDFFVSMGEAPFRAKQLFPLLHRKTQLCDVSVFSHALRQKLADCAFVYYPKIEQKLVSAVDGTVKYLFRLADGECVESVVMHYEHGNTICISSQVGCRMGCRFCASTLGGLVRNLTPSELLGQVISAQADGTERISNIVMMGIGEPLDNYDNVLKFLSLVNDPTGICIGQRHISLSTCGVVDKIYALEQEDLQITLSISLHAPCDDTRSAIMPINNKWNLAQLLTACADYFAKTGRRISFEYTLIAGQNDTPEQAKALCALFAAYLPKSMPIHVNLIPLNPVAERPFSRSDRARVAQFASILQSHHINATVRRKLGPDIQAACGQLRRQSKGESGGTT